MTTYWLQGEQEVPVSNQDDGDANEEVIKYTAVTFQVTNHDDEKHYDGD